jgi:predicted glycosyltransferase
VQDSWGLGHIQRVSKLARALQEEADCLILCGHREAGWIITEACEYLRIPSLNVPLSKGHGGVFWGRRSAWDLPLKDAIRMRVKLIEGVLAAFEPDAIVVENRPMGMMDELHGVLDASSAVKFFLTRGLMTHPQRVRSLFLTPVQEAALRADVFRTIIVAADRKVWDLASEYDLHPCIARKLTYVGYMSEPVDDAQITRARIDRGVGANGKWANGKWIVCSAGGGANGARLIEEFMRLEPQLPDAAIDIVQGPHSTLRPPAGNDTGQVRLHRTCLSLPLWHAAADLVVCPGSYNSLVEVMEGGAPIVAISVQPRADEQALLASRLSQHYPIRLMRHYGELREAVRHALRVGTKSPVRASGVLNFDGIRNARELILSSVTVATV